MGHAVITRSLEGLQLPASGTWVFDPAHTHITAVARHMMITKVRGHFTRFNGTIHVEEDPEASWVEVEIDATSIDTRNQYRDDHLRSPDFLDAERYPTLRYRSTGLRRTSPDTFDLDGELTIRDVTRPITLAVTYDGVATDPDGESLVAFTATGELDREAFGMTWNQALETGGVLVGKVFKLEFDIQARPQA